MTRVRLLLATGLVALLALGAAACGGSSGGSAAEGPTTIRLGYFPNLTHATAIVGVENGIFAEKLGDDTLETSLFSAGPAAVEALFSGALDATYIGPNPTITAYAKSDGAAVRVISGATSAGAALVVTPDINSAADLKGKKVASPQLSGTQDVALRWWLKDNGLATDPQGGGDVSIVPQENSATLEAFKGGTIAGAWVPEPWATRLVQEGGGKILVDERTLWPGGEFVTTQLVVRTEFLQKHPDAVRRLVEGQVAADAFVNANPEQSQKIVNDAITKYTGKGIAPGVVTAAWKNLTFTNDPYPSTLIQSADHAVAVGLLDPVKNLTGLYNLSILNSVLEAQGQKPIAAP
ncbi:MAG: ABC transporter substrate-binding protein [Acidobacteria bacterium]|nr:ABC transporter substrate-binding protein [Acidobacteriota bacterium]